MESITLAPCLRAVLYQAVRRHPRLRPQGEPVSGLQRRDTDGTALPGAAGLLSIPVEAVLTSSDKIFMPPNR